MRTATAIGPRREGDIGFAALRGGDVVGEHRVIFAGPGERIELAHIATDREFCSRRGQGGALGRRPRPRASCDDGRAWFVGPVECEDFASGEMILTRL